MNTTAPAAKALGDLSLDLSELVSELNAVFGPTLVAAMSGSKDTKAPIRWAKPGAAMRAEPERNLRFAHRMLASLEPLQDQRAARTWFVSSNPELGEDSPIDAIAQGRHRDVSQAASRLVSSTISPGASLSDESPGRPIDGEQVGPHSGSTRVGATAGTADSSGSSAVNRVIDVAGSPGVLPASFGTSPQGSAQEIGRAPATMKDVAELSGVSIKTVSNVVNGSARVSPETAQRVNAAIADLGYQVNMTARGLRQGRTGMIGLVVPDLRLPYFAELAYSVLSVTESHGLALLIEQSGAQGENEPDMLRSPRRRYTDGLLFSPVGLDPDSHPELDVDYPLVLLGERVFDPRYDHVTMANVEAAREATLHLAARGCRNIAVLGYHPEETMGSARLRYDGYRQALAEAGLSFDPRLLGVAGRWVRSTGHAAMLQVLDSGAPLDGVFAMNDGLALGALHALRERGISVPEDVAVVGFDDIEDAQYSDPPLSSIDPGRDEIAERAVKLLVAKIAGVKQEPQQIVAGFSLVERDSSRHS